MIVLNNIQCRLSASNTFIYVRYDHVIICCFSVRVLPHDNDTAGLFCAVLIKNRELPWVQGEKVLHCMVLKVDGIHVVTFF